MFIANFALMSMARGAGFSKAPIINGPLKLLLFTCRLEVSIGFASNMIKLSVARPRALILHILI